MKAQNHQIHSTSHGAIARTLASTIETYGVQSSEIFEKYDIDLQRLVGSDVRVLDLSMREVWHDAVSATQDDALGITFAEQFRPGSLNGLGFSWAASDNLLDAFHRLVRFFRVITSAGEVMLEENEAADEVVLSLKLSVPVGVATDASIDAALALFLRLCRFAKEEKFHPKKVLMQRPRPDNIDRFKNYFNCPIEFGSYDNKLIFSRQALEGSLPVTNPELARANDQVVQNYLQKFNEANFATIVNLKIVEALPSGVPSQESIAKAMHMSTRTLQRKLAQEDTSFSKLIEEARLALAKVYLTQSWRSIGEVSYLLGYSEPSNFTRSFKRATGLTPREYRLRAKEA